jgi:hypothetical protein
MIPKTLFFFKKLNDCIQFLLGEQLKNNNFNDFNDKHLLKMFQRTMHMFPGSFSILI